MRFELPLIAGRFEFVLVGLFVLPLLELLFVIVTRLALPFRFVALALALAFSFAFLLVFFGRLGLFSFAKLASLVFAGFASGDGSGRETSEDSPSLTGLLMSIATVCPALTTSP